MTQKLYEVYSQTPYKAMEYHGIKRGWNEAWAYADRLTREGYAGLQVRPVLERRAEAGRGA